MSRSRPDPLQASPPDVGLDEAGEIADRFFGVAGSFASLVSERDKNFLIDDGHGRRFVLKIHNPADDPAIVEMQTQAMLHISATDPALHVQRVCPTLDGALNAVLERPDGIRYLVRLLTFLEGRNAEASELSPRALRDYGAYAARVGRALRGFFHPAAGHALLWDIKRGADLRSFPGDIADPERRALVERTLGRFEERVLPVLPGLRAQVIHNDLARENVLFDADGRITGIVDFGDMVHSPLVCDLAMVLGSLLGERPDFFETADAAVRGYNSATPLQDEELAVLPYLVAMRAAANVIISAWRTLRYPEHADYIGGWEAGSWVMLETFENAGFDEAARRFREACTPVPSPLPRSAARTGDDRLLERRRRVLGPALAPLSYERPIHLVRGEGSWVFDAEGRRYLDAYNNVPVVGHCHPRVAEAIAAQARALNTNTRYLHESVVELAERLLATMPGLDHAMFVNSGSEANDLAWRLATEFTGGRGGIVTAGAYHGLTAAIIDLSPVQWPSGEQPEHVRTLPPPDGYRGPHRAGEPGWAERYAAYAGEAVASLEAAGIRPAALLVDPVFTSDGILDPTPAYLQEVARRVHQAGGVVIADEVQAGFGRIGSHLWSYQAAGIAPDMVTLGKPMGNGHPVAAVLARGEVVEAFARKSDFFSTFGGNPVACAAALAVLDVIEEEGLQRRAADVGAYLCGRLGELMRRHALLGDVRGLGLLVGVDLVRDGETREPAAREARIVMNGMRDRGVLVGSTGPGENVLKIRPPLVFGRAEADLLVETIDEAIAET